jgi:hypothetical protein
MKNASLEQWDEFYAVVGNLKNMAPWAYICSDDLIAIALEGGKVSVFCSVMGSANSCYGVSVYEGERGLRDINRCRTLGETVLSPNFVMGDQTCLTLYWGDRSEVPPDQKAVIRQLGYKYRGSGNWPYVLSFESRYAPVTPDARGIEVLTETFKNLCTVTMALAEGQLTPKWTKEKMLVRIYAPETGLWEMGWAPIPEVPDMMPRVTLKDELLQARLQKAPRCQTKIIMDLVYLNARIVEKRGERPYHPLAFCMLDESAHQILCMEPLRPEGTEVDAVLNGFISFVMQFGRMKQIRARNPWVLASLEELCAMCKIDLLQDALPEVDEIMQDFEEI